MPNPDLRANSISLNSSKSPSFSLFPSTPPHSGGSFVNRSLLRTSSLNRSSTEPSHRLFPSKPAIKKSKSQDQHHILVIEHLSEDDCQPPTSHGRQSSANPAQRSANSTTGKCPDHPEYSHPATETDTPTPIENTQDPLRRIFPERKSSMKKEASLEPHDRHQGEQPIGPTTEVSVARQISISRRQRQLLVPIAPKTARQPIKPRINEQSSANESRKSHHLTLEDG